MPGPGIEESSRSAAEAVGQELRNRRKELGLTQHDVAEKAGVLYTTVGRIERTGRGTLAVIIAMAEAVDLRLQLWEPTT